MASLPDLPVEILAMILKHLHSPECLKSFVLTSKRIYEVYSKRRTETLSEILYRLFHEELRILAEVHMCIHAHDINMTHPNVWADILSVLHAGKTSIAQCLDRDQTFQNPDFTLYLINARTRIFETRSIERKQAPTLRDSSLPVLCNMIRIYRVVHAVVEMFCERSLPRQAAADRLELTITEKRRLYRAFIRIELYHCILGPRNEHWPTPYFERPWTWLSMFPPHELDEMNCALEFVTESWEKLILYARREPRTAEPYEICIRTGLVDVVLRGLKTFLWQKELESNDPVELRKFFATIPMVDEIGLPEVLGDLPWARTYFDITSSRDGYPNEGDVVQFEGDHANRPNAAWIKTLVNNRMTNHYCVIAKTTQLNGLTCTGWALWDKKRLELWPELWNRLSPILLMDARLRTPL